MCGSSSIWAKVALAVVIVSFIMDIVGIATLSWMKYEITTNRIKVGLFKQETCVGETCTTGDVDDDLKDGNFIAAQVFEVFMLILIILAVIIIIVYLLIDNLRNNCMALTGASMCFGACFCGFVGMICWLVTVEDPYIVGFSMGLTVIAALLALIGGLLLLPDVLEDPGTPVQRFK